MGSSTPEIRYLERPEIEDQASALAREAGGDGPPFDALEIARRLGVTVRLVSFAYDGAIAGQLIRRGDHADILVREDDSPARRNFTIAHELGHLRLHGAGDWTDTEQTIYRRDFRSDVPGLDRAEFQANTFAAALLMPEGAVRDHWDTFKSPNYLAPKFKVSKPAMLRRLEELGIVVPSVEGFLYVDLEPMFDIPVSPSAPGLSDDSGPIPKYPPLALDDHGRIIPLSDAEREDRWAATVRALDAIGQIGDQDEPASVAEQVMRGIDEGRPHRKLFEGMY